jgi:hypothetical protein
MITPPPVGPPPPSTIETMRDVLTSLDAGRPRSMQTDLGPSELGSPCTRQIAMKIAGLPRQSPDRRPPWAPMQGTAMHALMEEALHAHNAALGRQRWLVEESLTIAENYHGDPDREPERIIGHGDAYDTDHDMVIDWKYVGTTALRDVKRKTIPNHLLVKPEYRVQAHLYGWGHWRAGRTPKWVRLVFLARSHNYDDSAEWTEAFDPDIAAGAICRYWDIRQLVDTLPLATNPALWGVVPAAPGKTCDWCPFARPGPVDGTGCPGNLEQKITKQTAGLIA